MLETQFRQDFARWGADVVTLGTMYQLLKVAYLVKTAMQMLLSCSRHRKILKGEFNGIKIFGSGSTFKLTDDEEYEIEGIVLDHVLPYDLKWNDETWYHPQR